MTSRAFASHSARFLAVASDVAAGIDEAEAEALVALLARTRASAGRVFVLGVGGGAANASHAVNDLRKLCDIEAYAPTDNVSELTARINDDGWNGALASWLRGSRLRENDMLLIFSVGGGDLEHGVSVNLVQALELAKEVGASIGGIVGRNGGCTARLGDAVVVVRAAPAELVTPLVEAMQAVVTHLLVSHPALQRQPTKWAAVEVA